MGIFNRDYNIDLYVACIMLDRRVESFLDSFTRATPEERRDIRYYVDMWLGCEITKMAAPVAATLALAVKAVNDLNDSNIAAACKSVLKIYKRLGGDENVAKGAQFTLSLQRSINRRLRKR